MPATSSRAPAPAADAGAPAPAAAGKEKAEIAEPESAHILALKAEIEAMKRKLAEPAPPSDAEPSAAASTLREASDIAVSLAASLLPEALPFDVDEANEEHSRNPDAKNPQDEGHFGNIFYQLLY